MVKIEREYGVQTTVVFTLWETDGTDLATGATFAAGDVVLMRDEAAETSATNLPTDEGQGYSLVLTAAEMQAARIVVYIVDQGTKAWLDREIVIETYGNASAQHTQEILNSANGVVEANVVQLSGDATAADNLEAAADGTGYNLGGGDVVAASVAGAVGSVTGNVGGNVVGSVGSVSGLDAAALQQIVDDLEDAGRLDLLIDAIKAKTDSLTFTGSFVQADVQAVDTDAVAQGGNSPTSPYGV